MRLTTRQRADAVATHRHVAVYLMETLARWVPTSPELEAKALFGRHIWELAQVADQMGRRTAELRLALHQSRPPRAGYLQTLELLRATTTTGDRLAGFYEAALPDLARRFDAYLSDTDPLLDEPTVRILERARSDVGRMLEQRDALLGERKDLGSHDTAFLHRLKDALGREGDFTDYRPAVVAEAGS